MLSSFADVARRGAQAASASIVVLDVGPNLGAISRAALISSDYVVVPLAPDHYSLQGLRDLGPTLRTWRSEWEHRRTRGPAEIRLPEEARRPTFLLRSADGAIGAYRPAVLAAYHQFRSGPPHPRRGWRGSTGALSRRWREAVLALRRSGQPAQPAPASS